MKPKGDVRSAPSKSRKRNPARALGKAEALLRHLKDDSGAADPMIERKLGEVASARQQAEEGSEKETLAAVHGIAMSLVGELDVGAVVKEILQGAIRIVGAQRGILFLGRRLEAPLIPVLAMDIAGEELEHLERVSRTILRLAQVGEFLITPDAMADPRLAKVDSVRLKEIRSVICARLVHQGSLLGVLYLDAPGTVNAFAPNAASFLESFAGIAAASLDNARASAELRLANRRLAGELELQRRLWELPSNGAAMRALKESIAAAAHTEASVLLLAEPGTEVEQVARAIHAAGPRCLRSFLTYNCAAGPRDLLESEIFGHARGSAARPLWGRPGLLRSADRGVLFLNEITFLDTASQAKLLEFFQDQVVQPVRSRQGHPVDVQLISATSLDPRSEVRARRLNRDLFWALNRSEIRVPALRERPEDVPVLLQHFLRQHAELTGRAAEVEIAPDALDYLEHYSWPWNTAQLEWLAQRILARVKSGRVDAELVRSLLLAGAQEPPAMAAAGPARSAALDPTRSIRTLAEVERDAIRDALVRTQGNRSKTARLLGIQRNTLQRKIPGLGVPLDGVPNRRGRK